MIKSFKIWMESRELKQAMKSNILDFLKDKLKIDDDEEILDLEIGSISPEVINDLLERGIVSVSDEAIISDIKNGTLTVSDLINRLSGEGFLQ